MPRRQFVADLQHAQQGFLPLGISSLKQGEDDGHLEFVFHDSDGLLSLIPVKVTAMVTDVSEYPRAHEYMLFCEDETSPEIGKALSNIRGTERKTVFELIDIVSATLSRLSPDRDGEEDMPNSQQFDEFEDEDEDDIYASDDEAFELPGQSNAALQAQAQAQSKPGSRHQGSSKAFRSRIRSDLIIAKSAGFKVGFLGHLLEGHNCYVAISIRIAKLGISEEAMQAWQIEPSDYLILVLQFPNGYKSNEELQSYDGHRLAPNIGIRVLTGKKYKPTLQETIKAFTVTKKDNRDNVSSELPKAEDEVAEGAIRETFISRPLNSLLQERLVPILRYRSAGMDWQGAENWYSEIVNKGASGADVVPDKFFEPEATNHALPGIVKADHFTDCHSSALGYSFPVLAMQFLMRHFVCCANFCLVCHRQLESELEAIKPYVCDSPLCLYQYMTLGFGPSIEHEILAQPYVVDLLVSFCYASAKSQKLKDFPDGLALMVPPIDAKAAIPVANPYVFQPQTPPPAKQGSSSGVSYDVGYDSGRRELIFHNKPAACPVRRGSWILLTVPSSLDGSELHCRVSDVNYFPTITIDEPIARPIDGQPVSALGTPSTGGAVAKLATPVMTPKWVPSSFQVYEQDFESLNVREKCHAICQLLDVLPTVKDMQEYLQKCQTADLKQWVERISPAGLSLLRWIIASNRSCIMQVDGDEKPWSGTQNTPKPAATFSKNSERLFGMKNWVQFRFAMGAPDKEQRFTTEVRAKAEAKALQFPTIFAWHGSPIHNWHMIIREGLHFKNTDHGRAYGHGVYHAKDANTSTGYSQMYGSRTGVGRGHWPNSVLRINTALALNEIVNATEEFVSSNPYYVVAQLDWIQTRYLFVSCDPTADTISIGEDAKPSNPHPQDPKNTPTGISGSVQIPASAVKSSKYSKDKRTLESSIKSPVKKLKGRGGFNDPIAIEDDDETGSVATDEEDVAVLAEEPDEPELIPSQALPVMAKKGNKKPADPAADFAPGTLDWKTLPLMPMPAYAVSGTTKRLMKELQSLQKGQEATTLADLGWYIDVDKIENVYQWIVELHSFAFLNPKLPLVSDMKKRGLTSMVLEIRFNKDFPFTPPYVRVVRPRFLSFAQGGGGHIVLGGAMCMELLTNTGWSSVSSMESVLMQIRLAISSDPPAKLDMYTSSDYGAGEAADGYMRACATHGWTVPPGFKEMAYGSAVTESSRQL